MSCASCHSPGTSCCATCKHIRYCSRACQTRDWVLKHKMQCPLFTAFREWKAKDGMDVSKLPHKGHLVWFDMGNDDNDHWVSPSFAESACTRPTLNGRLIFPATAISLMTTGTDAQFQWLCQHALEIGLDPAKLQAVGQTRRKDGETDDDWDTRTNAL